MKLTPLLPVLAQTFPAFAIGLLVRTTTGPIIGSEVAPGVVAWKGIPFAVPPIGSRRWTRPLLNKWTKTKNTTALGPACIQQLNKTAASTDISQIFYNNPPLAEDEDCLTINIWAPSKSSGKPKAVLFWIYGGAFSMGGSGTSFYDGASFAENQDIIVVSHNYRTNLFGFPNSPELLVQEQNFGLFDQQLALSWTRENIAKFGGDPSKITLYGLSAGGYSASLFVELSSGTPPFHGAIFSSGVSVGTSNNAPAPFGDFTIWNSLARHFGCPSANDTAQIDCLKKIPAEDLEKFAVDSFLDFGPPPDGGITVPNEPDKLIETGAVARVPVMIGDNISGASFLDIGEDNFTNFISQPPLNVLPAEKLRALYPVPIKFATDAQAIIALETDLRYRCPSALFADIFTKNNPSPVYRYVYGAVFPEFQLFPNAGAPEGTELPLIFGNLVFDGLNGTTNATEFALSRTMQTIWANFVKHPDQPPAPNWPAYTSASKALAELAFGSNVLLDDIVSITNSSSLDGACQLLNTLKLSPQ